MLGKGATQAAVAEELGTSTTSVRRMLKRDDFKRLISAAREKPDATPGRRTPRQVLEENLNATTKNGDPNINVQMSAAIALERLDDPTSTEPVIERVYITPDDPAHDQVVGILDATPADEYVAVVDAEDDNKLLAERDIPHPEFAVVHLLGATGHEYPSEQASRLREADGPDS